MAVITAVSQLGRPVGANGEETRQRIIAAALRCVAEKGYSRASIREIARAAQMTSGSLYHHFPNKSELLKATLTEIEDIALPRLRAAGQRGGDFVDRLEAVLDESDQLMREYPHLAAFERAMRAQDAAYLRRGDPDWWALKRCATSSVTSSKTQDCAAGCPPTPIRKARSMPSMRSRGA
jgi:AcrR family transcriptional regulator